MLQINIRCWDRDSPHFKFAHQPFMLEKNDIIKRLELFTIQLRNFTLHGRRGHSALCERQHVPSQMEFLDFYASKSPGGSLQPIKYKFIGRVKQIDKGGMDKVLKR